MSITKSAPRTSRSYRELRGAHDNGDGTVTFVLYAPDYGPVKIRGVQVESSQLAGGGCTLKRARGKDSGHWFAVAHHLKNTRCVEYLYQVEVDIEGEGTFTVGVSDPYSRQVDVNFTSALSIGRPAIPWVPFVRLPIEALSFYELHVFNMTAADPSVEPDLRGTYLGLIEKLPYIKSLGFNAITLMPIFDYTDRRQSHVTWNYNTPCHFFAPHQWYASDHLEARREFINLVNACHKQGLAVVLDVVLNQVGKLFSYARIYDPPNYPDTIRTENNPFLGSFPGNDDNPGTQKYLAQAWGGVDVDYNKPDALEFFKDVVTAWLTEYNLDGLRFDYTVGYYLFGQPGVGADALASWARRIGGKDCYLVAEHISNQPNEIRLLRDTEFDAGWNERYVWAIQNVLSSAVDWNEVKTALSLEAQHYPPGKWPVNYVGSHDKERLATRSQPIWRIQPAYILWATGGGVLLHWMGDEYGETRASRDATGLPLGVAPLQWRGTTPWLSPLLTRLLWLRKMYPALQGRDAEILLGPQDNVLVYRRTMPPVEPALRPKRSRDVLAQIEDETVIVAVNVGDSDVTMQIPTGTLEGTLYEYLTNTEVEAHAGRLVKPIRVASNYAVILVATRRWDDPSGSSPGVPGP